MVYLTNLSNDYATIFYFISNRNTQSLVIIIIIIIIFSSISHGTIRTFFVFFLVSYPFLVVIEYDRKSHDRMTRPVRFESCALSSCRARAPFPVSKTRLPGTGLSLTALTNVGARFSPPPLVRP